MNILRWNFIWRDPGLYFVSFLIFIGSMSHSYKPSRLRTWHRRHICKRTQLYVLCNEAGGKTQHIFFMRLAVTHSISSLLAVTHSRSSLLAVTRSISSSLAVTHSIYILHNESLSTYICGRWILACFLFCFVCCFLVNKIKVRSCVSPTTTTRQTPVSGGSWILGCIMKNWLNFSDE